MKRYSWIFVIIFIALFVLLFSRFSKITIQQLDNSGSVKITIKFYISLEQANIDDKVRLISERPDTTIMKSIRWKDKKTLEVYAMEKGPPKGFNTQLYIGPLKTAIPGLYKKLKIQYRASVPPFLTGLSPIVPSKGPITLEFSTPVEGQKLQKNIIADFDFELSPGYIHYGDGKVFKDLSRWILVPKQDLTPGVEYGIKFEGQLPNLRGDSRKTAFHRVFKVADVPQIVSVNPSIAERDVKLYQPIEVNFTEEMEEVHIKVSGMIGDINVEGKTALFKPHTVFVPGKTYNVKITGKSVFGQEMKPYIFDFTTMEMDDKWWVEINLRPLQKVVVYKGKRVVRSMVASGGLEEPENRTPLGFFTLKDRGEYFWTERISEGGLYWVRITGNYLIHSVPRGKDNQIIEEEFKKLGIPASHGCVRLKDEYAKWFYDTIPSGTLAIIHD